MLIVTNVYDKVTILDLLKRDKFVITNNPDPDDDKKTISTIYTIAWNKKLYSYSPPGPVWKQYTPVV